MAKTHALSDLKSVDILDNLRTWQHVVFERAEIDDNCNICANIFIENYAVLSDNTIVNSSAFLLDQKSTEDIFSPSATLENDPMPRSKFTPTNFHSLLQRGASVYR